MDNSATGTQGRVYVTSGISENAGVYAYPRGAATSAALPPLGAQASSSPGWRVSGLDRHHDLWAVGGSKLRLCAYRPQTKGKVESDV